MPRVTTSCSAIALWLLLTTAAWAQPSAPSPLQLFPVFPAWSQGLDHILAAPPAFAGSRAFFAVDGGQIEAYELDRGTRVWAARVAAVSTPATGDGLVFVAEQERLTALRQSDGRVAWQLPFTASFAVPLAWDNGWLIGADTSGTVFAFRATDGALIWRQELGAPAHAMPALAADRVYVALEDGRVVALDVTTGTQRWARRLGGPPNDLLALDDRIYVGSDDNFLYCLMASNGEVAWRWRTGGDVIGVPVVDDSLLYFVSRDNVLRALDRRSGSQRWKRALASRPTRGPVRAGNVLLVSGLNPRVFAFKVTDGTPAGEIAAPGELAASPYVVPDRPLPQVVLVARDQATGTRALAVRRTIDPPMDTPLGTLPGAITVSVPGVPSPSAGGTELARPAERAPEPRRGTEPPPGSQPPRR